MSDPIVSKVQAVEVDRNWRLLWISIFLGPIIGLISISTLFIIIGVVRQQPHSEPFRMGSMFFVFGLLFAHLFGIVPAAISAGLNILVARTGISKLGRLVAAPFMGALAGAVFFLVISGKNPILVSVITMVGASAFSSWTCVAIVERDRLTARSG